MTVLVTEAGFARRRLDRARSCRSTCFWSGQDLPEEGLAVDFPNDRDPAELAPWLDRLALIRVAFPAMRDGRGFSIAAGSCGRWATPGGCAPRGR